MHGPSSCSLSSQSDEEFEDGSQPSTQDGSQPKKEKKEVLKPLGKSKLVWKKVEVNSNFVNVKGGFSAQYYAAPSITCRWLKEQHVYVKLSKNENWFLKAVGGTRTQKGDLKAVNVFTDIRNASLNAEYDADATAVAEDEEDEHDDDPMMALDDIEEPTPAHAKGQAKAKAKGAAKAKAKSRSTLQTFSMPKHPSCTGWDANVEGGRLDIHVYRKRTSRKLKKGEDEICGNASCLYLRTDNIDWLLQYAADELLFQGVSRHREPEIQKECNSAVAGLNLEWDFDLKNGMQRSLMEFMLERQSASVPKISPKHKGSK